MERAAHTQPSTPILTSNLGGILMKAIVYTHYGAPLDVLHVKEVERPTPSDNEVLIKVHAASINAAEWHLVRADPFLARFATGLLKPKIRFPAPTSRGVLKRLVEA